ncbi:MAG: hypothetical protein J6W46_02660, partial [Spirochaetaceae bacterium]|nr:hypothetical protein [Spirochaetaceae bacterium]
DSISIEDFITQCDWATDSSSTAFYENHYYLFCAFDSEWHDGKWEWNAKNKMLTVYANSPFDDSVETLMYSIKICDEETIEIINSAHSSATGLKSKASIQESLRFYNRNTNSWQPSLAKAENFNYQNLYFKGGTFIIEELKKLNALDENISFLIESGIYSESYQQKFDDYWNPKLLNSRSHRIKGCLVQQPLPVSFHLFGELFKLGYCIGFHGNLYSNLVFRKCNVL